MMPKDENELRHMLKIGMGTVMGPLRFAIRNSMALVSYLIP
ncbi:MAG: hypothetical protein K0Q73_6610 [Paenibacillus sp.]|jgi:hypothetical protein|nr:hypothetical protein [Paenibacillus sp.]